MAEANHNPSPSVLRAFDFPSPTQLITGAGCVEQVGGLARGLGAQRVLLVTDAGIVAAGHADRVRKSLAAAGLTTAFFDRVRENPTTRCVEDCVAAARDAEVDLLLGLGGGSSMDTAKGCNFILTNGGRMQDYWGVGKATKPMLPFIAVPTTAGTGSETQSAALIADEQTHQKMACLDAKCAARIAILDPTLTVSQPPRVTAGTGIDAIAHTVETLVTTKRTELSQRMSRDAFQLCIAALPVVLRHPDDLEARARMQLGAALAGAAIEHSMLGATHAAANPLTAHFGIVHGHAVGLMLPQVVGFNAGDATARAAYAGLARAAVLVSPGESEERAVQALRSRLSEMLKLAGLAGSLAACGVTRSAIPQLAAEAAGQWTAGFNPRPITAKNFAQLYEAALG